MMAENFYSLISLPVIAKNLTPHRQQRIVEIVKTIVFTISCPCFFRQQYLGIPKAGA